MTRAGVAARVRAEKAAHPERFCSVPGCLWRIVHQDGRVTPCERHPAREIVKMIAERSAEAGGGPCR